MARPRSLWLRGSFGGSIVEGGKMGESGIFWGVLFSLAAKFLIMETWFR